ncbi:chromate transporter [Citrifermentans bremense]|uniref:Chromate transporter n=1 Tax=Citrifermentans bremense TaxID=60035 RepID=A0A6S6M2T5_9BACT|nr:chromate transporter [Citrifermentans bremense]BCG45971.1 chromate transporter [Citrifermentans bremense]
MGALLKLCWVFLKIGVVFFGGGYVLIPLLHRVMVDQMHWLSLKEFLDGVALSQLTPGPLAMLATFTGFKAGGFAGALAGTVCIFLPCTALMLLISSRYRQFSQVQAVKHFLNGILPAVVGLVLAAAFTLGRTSLASARDYILLAAGFLLLQFTAIAPMAVILGAAVIGLLLNFS